MAAVAQNLRRLAKLVVQATTSSRRVRRIVVVGIDATASKPPLQRSRRKPAASRNRFSRPNSFNLRLLQQNRHIATIPTVPVFVRYWIRSGRRMALALKWSVANNSSRT